MLDLVRLLLGEVDLGIFSLFSILGSLLLIEFLLELLSAVLSLILSEQGPELWRCLTFGSLWSFRFDLISDCDVLANDFNH